MNTETRQQRRAAARGYDYNCHVDVLGGFPVHHLIKPTRNNSASYRTGGSITGDGHRAAQRAAAEKPKAPRKPRAKKVVAQ